MRKIPKIILPLDKEYMTVSEIPYYVAKVLHPADWDALCSAERQHTALLSQAISAGHVTIQPQGQDANERDSRVSLEDFSKYAKTLGLRVKLTGTAIQLHLDRAATEKIRRDEEARNSGRYTLYEAAELAAKNLGDRTQLRAELEGAAASGDGSLPIYSRGREVRRKSRISGKPIELRPTDEAYWNDLNAWLRANEPPIKFEFPAPASQKIGAGNTAADGTAVPWAGEATSALPVTAAEIATAFPVAWVDQWPNRLRKAAGGTAYQWLTGTVVHRGSRKPGDANTYNPAVVAVALVLRGEMTRAACESIIKRCFPAWIDDWNRKAEYLKI
jgi:hypothetical protein